MPFLLTRLCTAMLLGSTLVGCAAVVKTPYQAPAVQTPTQFHYDKVTAQQRQQALYVINGGRYLAMQNSINWSMLCSQKMPIWPLQG